MSALRGLRLENLRGLCTELRMDAVWALRLGSVAHSATHSLNEYRPAALSAALRADRAAHGSGAETFD